MNLKFGKYVGSGGSGTDIMSSLLKSLNHQELIKWVVDSIQSQHKQKCKTIHNNKRKTFIHEMNFMSKIRLNTQKKKTLIIF